MQNKRCRKCNKLLLKVSSNSKGKIEIKCNKCKALNLYKLEVPETHRKQVS